MIRRIIKTGDARLLISVQREADSSVLLVRRGCQNRDSEILINIEISTVGSLLVQVAHRTFFALMLGLLFHVFPADVIPKISRVSF